MAKFKHHIFICQNTRETGHPRGSCNSDGKSELLKLFKESVKKYGLDGKVRSNKAGCLDQCEHGPTVVIYPEAVWYGGVKAEDADEIVKSLAEGRTVDRLKLKDSCINTPTCEHKPKKSS
ncbi:(2Fe-2S) ferredoxin domain-containing protein [bacterium]|nr:(2Fe-2S) ferredoxin domain-containing protein [bacterium]